MEFDHPVTLVGNGALRRRTLELARTVAPTVIAADGGANRLRAWRVGAHTVIGDMDSIEDLAYWEQSDTIVLRCPDQDSTDLGKCLRVIKAPLFVAVGFLGDRLDHSMAAMGKLRSETGSPVVLLGGADLVFAPPQQWSISLPIGTRFSILANQPVTVTAGSGLRWSPSGLRFETALSGRGVSNVVSAEKVQLEFDGPGAVIVVERTHLPIVVESLLAR